MKVVFMQNNAEQIFDGFIRGKLENTPPDMTLLNSSFNTFLLERKEKKKRRWFFWLFLCLSFFVLPFSYYIISQKGSLTNRRQDTNKVVTPIDSKNAGNSLNTHSYVLSKSPDSVFAKQKEVSDTFNDELACKNKPSNVNKLPSKIFIRQPDPGQQNNRYDKKVSPDSAILSVNPSQKMVIKPVDSLLKKKDKPVAKADTFYIVW